MSEFKGTKGPWKVIDHSWSDSSIEANGKTIAEISIYDEATEENQAELEDEMMYNFLLMSKACEMLEMLKQAQSELSRIKGSMMAHPDCTEGSEFDDYTSSAEQMENEIENLIKEATTI